jgi:hypothetical protein
VAEYADLAKLGGGLTPLWKVEDGMSKTLLMLGADGKQYVLRSVNKFAGQVLNEIQRGTLIETMLQDQISSYHPSAALIIPPLLKTAEIFHVEPRLFVVPDDSLLGKFRKEFSGLLVLFEQYQQEERKESLCLVGSTNNVGTESLFGILDKDPLQSVDMQSFLKTRLVDLLVGDRSRKAKNWRWVQSSKGETYIWQPIPGNRDQAFIRLDGFLKGKLRFYNPRLVTFGEDYSSIAGLTRSAWDMDRPFLVGLDKPTWDSVVTDLQTQLTDSVIDVAVQKLPPEHYQLVGTAMAQTLKRRRNRLHQAANRFYKIIAEYADIYASNQSDLAVIIWIDKNHVEIRLFSRSEDSKEYQQAPYFSRIFERHETREVRLYLLGGDDQVAYRGFANSSIVVRIIGGDGTVELIDSSRVRQNQIHVYTNGERPVTIDWGSLLRPALIARYNSDHGVIIGGGIVRYNYGFRKIPYQHQLLLEGGVSTSKRILFEYRSDFPQIVPRWSLTPHIFLSGVERTRFHGFGNNTVRTEDKDFYRVTQYRFFVDPTLAFSPSKHLLLSFAPVFKVTDTTSEPGRIVNDSLYGAGRFAQLGARAAIRWTRPNLQIYTGASIYPAFFDLVEVLSELRGEVVTYLPMPLPNEPTFVARLGAKKVWGKVPYSEEAYLGGERSLRGFELQRFAGNASVYGSADLRMLVGRFSFLMPAEFGVFVLTDAGRVYVEGESPGGWHIDAGGGVWLTPIWQKTYLVSFAFARSHEQTAFYLRMGFQF